MNVKNSKTFWSAFSLCLILTLNSACTTPRTAKPERVKPPYQASRIATLPIEKISTDQKELQNLKQQLAKTQKKQPQSLNQKIVQIDRYEKTGALLLSLNDQLLQAKTPEAESQILRNAIGEIANFYQQETNLLLHNPNLASPATSPSKSSPSLSLSKLRNAFQDKNYAKVIQLIEMLNKEDPSERRTPEENVYYGLSLAASGKPDAAKSVLEPLLNQPLSLTFPEFFRDIGVFFDQQKETELARLAYQRALEEIEHGIALQEDLLLRQNQLGSPPLPSVGKNITQTLNDAEGLLSSEEGMEQARQICLAVLAEIENRSNDREATSLKQRTKELLEIIDRKEFVLIQQEIAESKKILPSKGYEAARQPLLVYLNSHPYTPYRTEIDKALQELKEEKSQKQQIESEGSNASYPDLFQEANRAYDEERYEEAVQKYRILSEVDEFREQVSMLLPEAIDRLVKERRNSASKLFAQAREASDSNQKFELLSKSHKILQDTLLNYPNSSQTEKLRKNLEIVKKELESLNPDFDRETPNETPGEEGHD